jgi:hypothetical protein
MKSRILILIAIVAFATAVPTNAFGQMGKTVKANIKFDFHIGERVYRAGEYRIESISNMSDRILQFRSVADANKKQIIIATHSNEGKRQSPILVFQKYGENYFLTEIVLGTEWGYSIPRSRRQRESEKKLALASLEKIKVRLAKGDTKK